VSRNQLIVCFVIAIHGNWIPANPRFALPAGMTDFLVLGESFFCSVSRLGRAHSGYQLKAGQFKVKPFAERSRSGQLASTPLSERSLLMLYH